MDNFQNIKTNENQRFIMQIDDKIKTKQTKTAKLEIYKKYRNKVIDRIRIRRQSYYQNYFEQNKNN